MITVCLYGNLAQYGRRFKLDAASPAEAVRALVSQIDGLRQQMAEGLFRVRFGGHDMSEEQVKSDFHRLSDGVLHIVPVIAGSGGGRKGGIIQTVVGVVLLIVSYWVPALQPLAFSMLFGGIAQLLTKTPSLDPGTSAKQRANSTFSNVDNTTAQGRPMPIAYGKVYCGSRVISQGVETRRVREDASGVESYSSSLAAAVAQSVNRNIKEGHNPLAAALDLQLERVQVTGVAATAPNGKKYNTDFSNDSVRSRNYKVNVKAVKYADSNQTV